MRCLPHRREGSFHVLCRRNESTRYYRNIEDVYDFDISHEMISDITDAFLPELEEW